MTHICVSKVTIICSDNGLSPHWRQAIIWTIAGISLIGPLRTNFSEILIGIQIFSFKKMHLKNFWVFFFYNISHSLCAWVCFTLPCNFNQPSWLLWSTTSRLRQSLYNYIICLNEALSPLNGKTSYHNVLTPRDWMSWDRYGWSGALFYMACQICFVCFLHE